MFDEVVLNGIRLLYSNVAFYLRSHNYFNNFLVNFNDFNNFLK
jgi:hypothetical protein